MLSGDSRSSEKFVHGINVLMAKNYIDNLSEETRKGMLEKAEQGIWPSYAPLCYVNVDGAHGKRTIEPDPQLAPVIRNIFEWYATCEYSLVEVTKKATTAGMIFRKSGNPVPKATIHKILHNRIYTGDFDFDGKTYRGIYEPIISRELWQRVQEVIKQRLGRRRQKQKHDFAFSGLIACGHCGCSLVGELKKKPYVYYHCTGNKGKCPEPYVREGVLEAQFTAALRRLKFDDEVLVWVKQALRQSHADERREYEVAIARLQAVSPAELEQSSEYRRSSTTVGGSAAWSNESVAPCYPSCLKLRVRNQTRNTTLATAADVADTSAKRRTGLLRKEKLEPGEGLWIAPCESVHTFFMKFAIDLIYLDKKKRVRKVRHAVPPWRLSACFTAHSVLELPAGTAAASGTEPGDQLALDLLE